MSKGGSVSADFNPGSAPRTGYTPTPETATPAAAGDFKIERFKSGER